MTVHSVKVRLTETKSKDIIHVITPEMQRKPTGIIMHCGTNDISDRVIKKLILQKKKQNSTRIVMQTWGIIP